MQRRKFHDGMFGNFFKKKDEILNISFSDFENPYNFFTVINHKNNEILYQ